MYDKREYDQNPVAERQMLYAAIKKHVHNFNQYNRAL